jgi:hypothetical protein
VCVFHVPPQVAAHIHAEDALSGALLEGCAANGVP